VPGYRDLVVRTPDTPSSPGDAASCEVSELGTCVQITARGEFDLATVSVVREATGDIALAPGRLVVLDLCGATFVGTAVIHFAVGLHARAVAHGCSLVVVARPPVRELFALAGVDGVTIVEDGGGSVTTEPAS
jgi:anti-anti-sigma regulatory factor